MTLTINKHLLIKNLGNLHSSEIRVNTELLTTISLNYYENVVFFNSVKVNQVFVHIYGEKVTHIQRVYTLIVRATISASVY